MMHITRVWLCLGLTWLAVAARYLPTPELIVDSLVPFSAGDAAATDTSRPRPPRSIEDMEGSGDDSQFLSLPISPQPIEHLFMERLQAAPDTPIMPMPEKYNTYMERLQAAPDTSTPYEEEGSGAEPIPIGGMLKDVADPFKETFAKEPGMHEVLEDLDKEPEGLPREDDNRQGNSLNVLPSDDRPQSRHEEDERDDALDEGSGLPDTDAYDATNVTIIDLDNEKILKLGNEGENVTTAVSADVENSTTEQTETSTLPEEVGTTSHELIVYHTTESNIDTLVIEMSSIAAEVEDVGTDLPSTVEPELVDVATTEQPELVSVPIQVFSASSSESPVSSETASPNLNTDETVPTTSEAEVEVLDKAEHIVVLTAAKEATMLDSKKIDEASGAQTISTFIMIGALIVAFMSLVIFIVFRNRRKRSRNLQDESTTEGDTAKALLTNGKYKPESDEVKNNEISPLVINKFEKSPNFSSQKNLNTTANDKNIEKDNVLKQAIIEDEVEEAKRAIEEEKEDCKKAAQELKSDNGDAEKVVVRTHIDLDSIPRKPLIITKNGNTYHSVANGET